MKKLIGFLLIIFLLTACSATETAVSPTAVPATPRSTLTAVPILPTATPTAVPAAIASATIAPPQEPLAQATAEPTMEPTAKPTIEPTSEPTAVAGRDAGGAFFYGNPNAEVTLIDFSDFL